MTGTLDILFAGNLIPHTGGSGTANATILEALHTRGHRIRAISMISAADLAQGDWYADTHPYLNIRRVVVPAYRLADTASRPGEMAQVSEEICRLAEADCTLRRPDLALLGDPNAIALSGVSRRFGLPNAMVVHGTSLRRLYHRDGTSEEIAKHLDDHSRLDHLIAVAENLVPVLQSLGLDSWTIIPNVCDSDVFVPTEKDQELLRSLRIASNEIVVGHFSNLKPLKRPLDLAHAATLALARNPNLVFVIGGDGVLRAAMEEICAALGIAHRFRFCGWVRSDRMPAYYSICDLVAMPSESEARAMVYLETQASGRVLIATDIASARETVEDGVTGLLYPMGSIEELAERILLAAGDAALRRTIGQNARQAALAQSLDSYGAALEKTLLELASRHNQCAG